MKIRTSLRLLIFSLLGLFAQAATASAAQSFRLYEILAQRFIKDSQGVTIIDQGTLTATGEFKHNIYRQLAAGENIPAEAMNLNLFPVGMWPAYDALGQDALANFQLDPITVNGTGYFVVSVAAAPKLDVGTLVNLSARGVVTPGDDPLIGGFVITDHPRRVLIRGVGPTLSDLNVAAPLANPTIRVLRLGDSTNLAANDDWGTQDNAADIATAAATVGAFPLRQNSKDAALLIELPPGVYTTVLTSADGTGGTALLEIYTLP